MKKKRWNLILAVVLVVLLVIFIVLYFFREEIYLSAPLSKRLENFQEGVLCRMCTSNAQCSSNQVCSNRCCKNINCTDSDGGINPSVYGLLTRVIEGTPNPQVVSDVCIDPSTLNEQYCYGTNLASMNLNCVSGTCDEGKCTTCTDSDGGINLEEFGTVNETTLMGGQELSDFCWNPTIGAECEGTAADGCFLVEHSCNALWNNEEGTSRKEMYSCPDICKDGQCDTHECNDLFNRTCSVDSNCFTGEVCLSGCCVDSSCSETDSGRNPLTAGSAVKHIAGVPDSAPSVDSCVDGNTLTEFYCNGINIVSEQINCQPGTCVNGGGCVEICRVDGVKNDYETDVDCGGRNCADCSNGQACRVSTDCASGYCTWDGVCALYPAGINANCVPIKYESGTTAGHINIIILGGQYDYQTPFQLNGKIGYDKYVEDVYRLVEGGFLNIAPYSDFSKINVFMVKDLSGTSSWVIDHACVSSVNWDCSLINSNQGCNSPLQSYWHERACRKVSYHSSYWVGQRMNTCGTMPNKVALVLINDDHYGGVAMGTTTTTATVHGESVEIAKHELLGHAIGNLDDEYSTSSSSYSGSQPIRLNCDITPTCERWSDLISEGVPNVDCIPGCYYYESGINRNTDTSLMRKLGYPFYPVNERAICCRFLALTGTISPSCQFFETTGIPLQEYCASPPAKGQEVVTEFWIEKQNGEYVISGIRENLWHDLDEKSNVGADISFEAFDKSGTAIRTLVQYPVLHDPMAVGDDEASPMQDKSESFVVYVTGEADAVDHLVVREAGKSLFINAGS